MIFILFIQWIFNSVIDEKKKNYSLSDQVVQKPITRIIRLTFIILLTVHDVGYSIYCRVYDPSNR